MTPRRESCPRWAEQAQLVDGELTENRARAVRKHLGACRRCGAEVEGLERLVAELAAPPDGLRLHGAVEAIMSHLDEPLPPAVTRRGRRRSLALALAAGLSAAVVLLAVAGPLLVERPTAPPQVAPVASSRSRGAEQGAAAAAPALLEATLLEPTLLKPALLEPVSRAHPDKYWPGSLVRSAGSGARPAQALMQLLLRQSRPAAAGDGMTAGDAGDEAGAESCVCRRRPALLQSM